MKGESIRLMLVALVFGLSLLFLRTVTSTAMPVLPPTATMTPSATITRTETAQPIGTPRPVVPSANPRTATTSVPTPPIAPHLPSPGEQTRSATTVTMTILAYSTLGWPIELYQFGSGPNRVVFIGGIHGGSEANTIQLAYQVVDHFAAHPEEVPSALTVYIIPAANPDGLVRLIGHAGRFLADELPADTILGRFNGNDVDLNRNWACDWQPIGRWQKRSVNAGSAPFSEIETATLRDFLDNPAVQGVIFWHSAVPGVFAGGCEKRFAAADELATVYADAASYPFLRAFTAYPVTGDAVNWLAVKGIPAIEVELTNHTDTEWEQNLQGVLAVLAYFVD